MVNIHVDKAVPPLVLIDAVISAIKKSDGNNLEIVIGLCAENSKTYVDAHIFKLSYFNMCRHEVASMRMLRIDDADMKNNHSKVYPIADHWSNGSYEKNAGYIYDYLARKGFHQVHKQTA